MTNEELEKWVGKKIIQYRENKVDCLEMMLYETNQVIEQFLKSPSSKATRGVLESCMKCNKKFMSVVDSGRV
jgi:dsDNA-binding SOS-regulon protein